MAEVVEGAYFHDCQGEDPLEEVALLEGVLAEAVAYFAEWLVEVLVEAVVFLGEIARAGTAVVDFAYNPEELGNLQGMEAVPFARLDVANAAREAAAPQASRCTGSSLSRHNCSFLRLGVLLLSAQQLVL